MECTSNSTMLKSIIQRTSRLSLQSCCTTHTPSRGTAVFRRMYEPIPGTITKGRALRRRHWVYVMVENRSRKPAGNMDILLLDDFEGYGLKGDVINVKKSIGRFNLLPTMRATYPTPENIAAVQAELEADGRKDRPKESVWAQKTLKNLAWSTLYVQMSAKNPWTLDKSHVRIAFRRQGVELTEDCIELPDHPITEATDFTVNVTVNKSHTVPVAAKIDLVTKEGLYAKVQKSKRPIL